MTLLEASGICHRFDYPLFEDIDLTLDATESVAIIGVSGSGKSTLLHILSTLLTPQSGQVTLMGQSVNGLDNRALVALRRDILGLIFQSHYLFKGFSAYENLEVAAILGEKSIDPALIDRLGIAQVMSQKVTELSGGQQQRVSIARVLTKQPKIIFADEPTGNLDHTTATEVMDLFSNYLVERGAAMVLVTHDETMAHRCDRVYRLEARRLSRLK